MLLPKHRGNLIPVFLINVLFKLVDDCKGFCCNSSVSLLGKRANTFSALESSSFALLNFEVGLKTLSYLFELHDLSLYRMFVLEIKIRSSCLKKYFRIPRIILEPSQNITGS